MKQYRVIVSVPCEEEVLVWAESSEDACEKALDAHDQADGFLTRWEVVDVVEEGDGQVFWP